MCAHTSQDLATKSDIRTKQVLPLHLSSLNVIVPCLSLLSPYQTDRDSHESHPFKEAMNVLLNNDYIFVCDHTVILCKGLYIH